MTRYFPTSEVTFELEHRGAGSNLENADTVTLQYKLNDEDKAAATPTNTATGKYAIVLIPSKSGVLWVEWTVTADGITSVKPDQVKIWPSSVQDA